MTVPKLTHVTVQVTPASALYQKSSPAMLAGVTVAEVRDPNVTPLAVIPEPCGEVVSGKHARKARVRRIFLIRMSVP